MTPIIEFIKSCFSQNRLEAKYDALYAQQEKISRLFQINSLLSGKIILNQLKTVDCLDNIQNAEFKVFSQWGDDGIIQYLISHLNIDNKVFIEFGVENYLESNTRFLLMNDNWTGLVMDSSDEFIKYIINDEIYWKYDLTARNVFITIENINEHIASAGITGDIGLLHIDIDGNDYWVWKAIEVVQPVIAIIEYNSLFGVERPITIPYKSDFARFNEHHSGLYAGSSLLALCDLAEEKGYYFVGTNSAGNNAYFVKKERIGNLKRLTASEGFTQYKFREHRDENGAMTYLSRADAITSIRRLPVYNTRENRIEEF